MALARDAAALHLIAATSEDLNAVAAVLRGRPEMAATEVHTSLRIYRAGPKCEYFIEATLTGGSVVTWFVQVGWADQWTIASGVVVNRGSEQETVSQFDDRTAETVPDLAVYLQRAREHIAASTRDLALAPWQ